ncbi:MAG: hypothetical protein FJW39_34355 [Acidobacteria bacterium]|nr:hypothetical protein [Acidobacteriota bacterium]
MRGLYAMLLAAIPAAAQLTNVQSVYLLPMSSGFDQYLAHQLTRDAVFPVVTDPKLADAVFTDQLGAGFERRLQDLYPPPPAPEPAKDEKDSKKDKQAEETAELKRAGEQRTTSSFGRGQGNVFLVDLKTRRVLWSAHDRPKTFRPDELEKTSARVVDRLKKSLGRTSK